MQRNIENTPWASRPATWASASTPLSWSCSQEGKQRTLCPCINRITQVRERSFPKRMC